MIEFISYLVREFVPNVIEPSFGIGRILYSLLEHSFYVRKGDEQRAVFSFRPSVAPFKVLLAPISHHDDFVPLIQDMGKFFKIKIVTILRRAGITNKVDDSSGSIGRRYARNDELGTPFAITFDFQTLKDGTVTLRERDSTHQIRSTMTSIIGVVQRLVFEERDWDSVVKEYPSFTLQE